MKKMKTKTKLITLLEIAIVLCSVFLVALPAIAAEQTTQEVSAAEITTASEDDYVLGIYGNANEDNTIDMRDLTYVKLIFFGKKPETELADAKYDGKINPLDFIQIKLIIVGKEKELTIVDDVERTVTIDMPLERIVSIAGSYGPETFCAFGVQDRLVGVADYAKVHALHLNCFLEDIPGVGGSKEPDIEMILELRPQIVHSYECYYHLHSKLEETLNAAGFKLVPIDCHKPKTYSNAIRTMGYMLDKQERAKELIYFEQQHHDLIEEGVEYLTKEQKPRVYLEAYKEYGTYGPGHPNHDALIACGGINIFADIGNYAVIDPEAVIERNPQVIIKSICAGKVPSGYGVTDTGPMEELRNEIMSRAGWDQIDAVKNGRVYLISTATSSTHACVFRSYNAKCLHPKLFEDMDPIDIHEEWFKKFLGIVYVGVYAYPPPESW
jgi:iron complex transport system substrate-binding protein